MVYAQDVQPQMLEAIERRVAKENLRNVGYHPRDADRPERSPPTPWTRS